MLWRKRPSGVTMVEVLVVMAIIAVLVVVLLPAIQSVRATARRAECQNHMRQVGLAISAFESAFGFLPSAAYGRPYEYIRNGRRPPGDVIASTFTDLLPFIHEQSVADQYDWSKDWFAAENQQAVNCQISTYRCPASPGNDVQTGIGSGGVTEPSRTAAVGDYSAVYSWGFPLAVPANPANYDIWGVSALSPVLERGGYAQPRLVRVTDGLSRTLTVVEQSDHGQRWVGRTMVDASPPNAKAWAPWAGESCTWILSYTADAKTWSPTGLGPGNINANNSQGIYSFHDGGANVVLLDNSVHFLSEQMDALVLFALVTRSRGESVEVPQ